MIGESWRALSWPLLSIVSQRGFYMIPSQGVWEVQSQEWDHFGPPFRPVGQDIELFEWLIADHGGNVLLPFVRAVLLGVTPEIATMRWPPNTELLAIDHNVAMIRNVWPASKAPGGKVVCAHWFAMPVVDGFCDVVIADGCFSQLPYPGGYSTMFREIRRVLRPGGIFVTRAFVMPSVAERVEDVLEDLRQRKIGNFHVFKWRLAMALQCDVTKGVSCKEIWNTWHQAVPDPAILASEQNWPLQAISTIDSYRDSDAYRTFPTLNEFREVVSPYFMETDCFFPDYELGDRCPIINLQVRK